MRLLDGQVNVPIVLVVVIPLVAIAVALVAPIHAGDNAQMGAVLLVLIHAEALVAIPAQRHAQQRAERLVLGTVAQIAKMAVRLLVLHLAEPDVLDAVEHAQEFAPDVLALVRLDALLVQAVLEIAMESVQINVQEFAQRDALPPRTQRLMPHVVDVLVFVKQDALLVLLPAKDPAAQPVPVVAIQDAPRLVKIIVSQPVVLGVPQHAEERVLEDALVALERAEITALEIVGQPVKPIVEVHVLVIVGTIAVQLVGKIAGRTVLRYVPHLVEMLVQILAPQDALEIASKTAPLVACNHARVAVMTHVAGNARHARTIALLVALALVQVVPAIALD